MRNYHYLRNAFTLGAGLTLFLLVRCSVPERDYSPLGIGENAGSGGNGNGGGSGTSGNAGSDGHSGSSSGGAAGAGGNELDGGFDEDAGDPDASSGNGGAGGSDGTGGTGGSAGTSGTGGSTGSGDCDAAEICVPSIPSGWQGPLAVNTTGVSGCPGTYATTLGTFNAGLQASAANCACGCVLNGVSCFMESGNTGDEFDPGGTESCVSPPTEDDCLTARVAATCSPQPFANVPTLSWQTTALTCGGASAGGACSGGACYADPGAFGDLCISRSGDFSCPAGFPARTQYFGGVSDNRACSACTCFPTGQECVIDIQVCDLGFTDYTLNSADEIPACLNSSDGDGVTLLSTNVVAPGSCTASGSAAQGSATPTNPLTVCCVP